jgi:hypothetical protein
MPKDTTRRRLFSDLASLSLTDATELRRIDIGPSLQPIMKPVETMN